MPEQKFLGTGWHFPPTFSQGGEQVGMVSGSTDVHQSLHILLSTQPGERIMQPDFGCDLIGLQFSEMNQQFVNRLKTVVSDAITLHEPRIKLETITLEPDDIAGRILINITFKIKGTNSRFNMVHPFYLNEGNS